MTTRSAATKGGVRRSISSSGHGTAAVLPPSFAQAAPRGHSDLPRRRSEPASAGIATDYGPTPGRPARAGRRSPRRCRGRSRDDPSASWNRRPSLRKLAADRPALVLQRCWQTRRRDLGSPGAAWWATVLPKKFPGGVPISLRGACRTRVSQFRGVVAGQHARSGHRGTW